MPYQPTKKLYHKLFQRDRPYLINVELQKVDQPQDFNDVQTAEEDYQINIDINGNTLLQCKGYISFIRALETIKQLLGAKSDQQSVTIFNLPILIKDSPSYNWRGVLIDTSRHFLPVQTIKKVIDGMRVSKLNILHIHFTDSESFPLYIQSFPDLTKYGAYTSNQVYNPTDIKDLISYGQINGVLIVPEIDTPAHTRSWSNSPNLQIINSCKDYPKEQWYKQGQLDPTLNETMNVLKGILTDVQGQFFQKYLHLGGDEINKNCWDWRPSIKQFMQTHNISNYDQLQNYFRSQQSQFVQKNRTKMYWFFSDQANSSMQLDQSDIIQYWDISSNYASLNSNNNSIVLSTYDYLYFDCGTGSLLGTDSWCDPYKTWWRVYNFSPLIKDINNQSRVLGAEVCNWAELISYENINVKIWPRANAFSERLWNTNQNLTKRELAKKLVTVMKDLQNLGIGAQPFTSQYCELHIDDCFFP